MTIRTPPTQDKRHDWHTTATAAIALLAETFPRCFFVYEARRKPLKIGIHLDILAALDGALTPQEIGTALRYYCGNRGYLRSVRIGAHRIDLEGQPADPITTKDVEHAQASLRGTLAAVARKKVAPASSPPKRLTLADLKSAAQARKQAGPPL